MAVSLVLYSTAKCAPFLPFKSALRISNTCSVVNNECPLSLRHLSSLFAWSFPSNRCVKRMHIGLSQQGKQSHGLNLGFVASFSVLAYKANTKGESLYRAPPKTSEMHRIYALRAGRLLLPECKVLVTVDRDIIWVKPSGNIVRCYL